jgi:hypothetical protein
MPEEDTEYLDLQVIRLPLLHQLRRKDALRKIVEILQGSIDILCSNGPCDTRHWNAR